MKRITNIISPGNLEASWSGAAVQSIPMSIHNYEIRPRADKHGFDLHSDALQYSPLWYRGSNPIVDAVRYARSYSWRHSVVIRVYDEAGNVIETHQHKGDFKES